MSEHTKTWVVHWTILLVAHGVVVASVHGAMTIVGVHAGMALLAAIERLIWGVADDLADQADRLRQRVHHSTRESHDQAA